MWVKEDGTITDVVYGSPASTAGLAPLMKISAVDGRKYGEQVLREEIRAAKSSPKPIEVSVVQGTFAGTFSIDYHGGEQFPHLERIEGRPDLLSDIMRPHAKP
jgi:predicted metalloprotease with PDZ domain